MAFWSIHNRGPRDLQPPQSSWMNKFTQSPEAPQPFMDMLSPHSFLMTHSYRAALWAPCTLVEDERKRHAENRVNIQCGQVALTLLQRPSSQSLQECEGREKLYSGFLPLSVLRSVPELHHNDRGFNSRRTLVGSHKDLAEKPKYLTKALDRHCPGESFVFADDRFLFSNMDMQHIQHYTHCSLLRKTPSGRPRSVCTLSHG